MRTKLVIYSVHNYSFMGTKVVTIDLLGVVVAAYCAVLVYVMAPFDQVITLAICGLVAIVVYNWIYTTGGWD